MQNFDKIKTIKVSSLDEKNAEFKAKLVALQTKLCHSSCMV